MAPRMKKQLYLSFATLGFIILSFNVFADIAPAPHSYGLDDCFQASIRRSEAIANQDELILQAEEKYKQAIGSILPNISGVGTYYQQQNPNNALGTSISPGNQTTAKLTGTQYLFQGLREIRNFPTGQIVEVCTRRCQKTGIVGPFRKCSTKLLLCFECGASGDRYSL